MDLERIKVSTSRCSGRYKSLVESGFIKEDKAQLLILKKLDFLIDLIELRKSDRMTIDPGRWLRRLKSKPWTELKIGIYLFGGVGTGKSMLMDLFYKEVLLKKKLRTHFHKFMQEVHDGINIERQNGNLDPINSVAIKISKTVSILCFDEFQITDITDAMIVGRLFEKLIQLGTYIVTTSNRPPNDLYENGLNRQLFVPFIDLFKEKLFVVELNTTNDYRREKLADQNLFLSPINSNTQQSFNKIWNSLVVEPCSPLQLRIKGRTIQIFKFYNGVGRSSFDDLCVSALGALDYLVICDHVRVLFIENIPKLNEMQMDSAKRFVTLVDTLYESRIKIICLADEVPERLYTKGKGSFEFERTVSRLYEMQSSEWVS